jgi:small subunit ribosomal protein S16
MLNGHAWRQMPASMPTSFVSATTTPLRHSSTAIAIRRDSLLMVKIRLMRTGMKGAASYRVVIADARSPRDGRIIENIGWYNPRTDPASITIDAERAKHWLSVGAQPSDSVRSLLQRSGVLPRPERTPNPATASSR